MFSDKTTERYYPARAHYGDAGYDLKARLAYGQEVKRNNVKTKALGELTSVTPYVILYPGDALLMPTGAFLNMPKEETVVSPGVRMVWEAQVRPRSGLAVKHKISVLNSPGTVDCCFEGEVHALLYNAGDEWLKIEDGDRIAQLVFSQAYVFDPALDSSDRGENGYGSTGV